jgi:aspartyl-tRNA(Asn)/glutamyl-tRNA(Gln) amidotransferase subunit B
MLSELQGHMNAAGVDIEAIKIKPSQIVELLALVDSGTLNSTMAKTVFDEMFETGGAPKEIAEALGLVQISDADAIASAVSEAIQNNPNPVKDYLGGKETALRFLVGQVMKLTRGKANPQMASELLRERLEMMR